MDAIAMVVGVTAKMIVRALIVAATWTGWEMATAIMDAG